MGFRDFLSGDQTQQPAQPLPAQPAAASNDFRSYLANGTSSEPRSKAVAIPEAPTPPLDLRQITSASPSDLFRGAGETAVHVLGGTAGSLLGGAASYAGRLLPEGDWDRAQQWADATQKFFTPPAPTTLTGKAAIGALDYLGQKATDFGQWVGNKTLELTGNPAIASAVDATVQTVPAVLLGKSVGRFIPEAGTAPEVVKATTAERPHLVNGPDTPAPTPNIVAPTTGTPVTSPLGSSAAAVASAIQKIPETSAPIPEVVRPAEPTVTIKGGDTVASLPEQASNEAILARVGHTTARISALQGDTAATVFENDLAKRNPAVDPNAAVMKQQLDGESATNQAFANKLASDTGGTTGTEQSARYARGNSVADSWNALQDWHDSVISDLYNTAKQRLGNTPVTLRNLTQLSPDLTRFPGTQDAVAFQNQMRGVMQQLKIMDPQGNALPTTASTAEAMRQWLNKDHGPDVWSFVKDAKQAIDSDVTSAAGQDIFAQARAANALAQRTLYDNKALARIFDKDSKGNTIVKTEDIPDAISRLGVDSHAQFTRIMTNMPDGLQPLGTQAMREMAAHYASNIEAKGTNTAAGGRWKYRDVSKYIADNNMKLSQIFNPDAMGMIHDLDQAGKITATDRSYVGAAAQKENFALSTALKGIPRLGQLAGGLVGSVMHEPVGGTIAGGTVGTAVANKLNTALQKRAVMGRIVPLESK